MSEQAPLEGSPRGQTLPLDDSLSTEELMSRYVQGDGAAFEMLYQRLSPRLFGYLLRLTRRPDRAEDLVQTTFSKVHRARASYLDGAPVLPWMLSIARRAFLDEQRRARVRREELSEDGSVPGTATAAPSDEGPDAELVAALERALDTLPPAHAEAIQLTKITGLSVAEAAEVLGTTKTAVKLRVHRGYLQLRRELARFEDEAHAAHQARQAENAGNTARAEHTGHAGHTEKGARS
ncbi:MAG TPA: RNA polymerase sigma factor [Polyangiaceae bacterium]|nr:RNA polymerase sigma factor [Polyangiaceae bacterium]